MSDTIILQRVVPHYRVALFSSLYERFGWRTVAASNPPQDTFLSLRQDDTPWLERFPYQFKGDDKPYHCDVPVEHIVDVLKPRRVISEFSMWLSTWRDLPRLRWQKRIDSYALWSHGA